MAKKIWAPEENARRGKFVSYRKWQISAAFMISRICSSIIAEFLENGLDAELDYSKYDYKSQDTGNNRNGPDTAVEMIQIMVCMNADVCK